MKRNLELVAMVAQALLLAKQTAAGSQIVVEPVPQRSYARIGIDGPDVVLLLPRLSEPRSKSVRLSRLLVDYNVSCNVKEGSNSSVTILKLLAPDEHVQSVFIEVVAMLLRPLARFSPTRIDGLIHGLIEMFRAMESPSGSTLLGLWGELFVIGNASDPTTVGRSWHPSTNEKFDFSMEDVRVEVKTTIGPRRHHFSLEQVRPIPGLHMLIASLVVSESPRGLNVVEMVQWAVAKVKEPEIAMQVKKTALKTIGSSDLTHALPRLDLKSAKLALRYYECYSVPQPTQPDLGVSEVRFVSDLQLVPYESQAVVSNKGRLGRGLIKV